MAGSVAGRRKAGIRNGANASAVTIQLLRLNPEQVEIDDFTRNIRVK